MASHGHAASQRIAFVIVDVLCCFIVITPVNATKRHLEQADSENRGTRRMPPRPWPQRSGDVCLTAVAPHRRHARVARVARVAPGNTLRTKYNLWSQFYVVTISYMYLTRVVVQLIEATVPFQVAWASKLVEELITIAYYVFVGYKLRPAIDNEYREVRTTEEEEEQEAIPMDTFDRLSRRSNASTAAAINAGQYD